MRDSSAGSDTRLGAAKDAVLGFLYRAVLKPVLFLADPERVHDGFIALGRLLGGNPVTRAIAGWMFGCRRAALRQTILGIRFENPVGLSAGFDKDGRIADILPAVGFGFAEIGSVTDLPQPGNPRPRLWRLVRSRSIAVWYGLKSAGADAVIRNLRRRPRGFPLGVSIAKNTLAARVIDEEAHGIASYAAAYRKFAAAGIGDYIALNISCPNVAGGEPFAEPAALGRLLAALRKVPAHAPLFIKLPAELAAEELDAIIEVARAYRVAGFISSNLAKSRRNDRIVDAAVPEHGGLSGKVVEELANRQIEYLYKRTHGEFVIIGSGGVFSAADAYKKIRLGASLVELITGMIFEGPQLVGRINRDLAALLARDGYAHVSEAVGADNRAIHA